MRGAIRTDTRKHSGKISLKSTDKAGNGTVMVSVLPNKDTEYYQIDKHGDYVQEAH